MADINDIVINITMDTKPLTTKGFGLALILGSRAAAHALDKHYGEYSDLPAMVTAGFTATDSEYKMAGMMFAQSPRPEKVAVYCRTSTQSITEGLAELMQTHNDWYALLITERTKVALAEAGLAAMTSEKLFFGCSDDTTAPEGRSNPREAYLIHNEAAKFPEAAWVGMCLPQTIGSITWKWKSPALGDIKAATYNTTQLESIRNNNSQTLTMRSGVIYSNEGITTGKEYIDNMQSRDYIKARLEEALFGLQIRNGKIPYDNSGFAMIESSMREVFKTAGSNGIIARVGSEADAKKSDEGVYMYKIDMPERSEIGSNDRAARIVPGIKFAFTVAGAVHRMEVSGTIEV